MKIGPYTTGKVYCGDCITLMREIPDGAIDAAIVDPPYCSGARTAAEVRGRSGMSRKAKWAAAPLENDRMTSVGFIWFMRELGLETARSLKDGGSMLCFIDWRQYPNLYAALETCNLRIQGLVVWDKIDMALGNGFRNQHELIIHAAKGVPFISNRGVPNVLRIKRITSSDIHPTEKPIELMKALLDVVTSEDMVVLDPLCGSGSVLVAAEEIGRHGVGFEISDKYVRLSNGRISAMKRGLTPEEFSAGQKTLFND